MQSTNIIDYQRLFPKQWTKICKRKDPLNDYSFIHSAGPHLAGMIENNRYQTINPSDFGFKLKFNIGHAVTGWQGVKSWIAKQLKIFLDDKQAKNLSQEIREYTSIKGPFLEDKRLREFIYRSLRLCRVTSLSMTMAERSRSHQKLNITNEN